MERQQSGESCSLYDGTRGNPLPRSLVDAWGLRTERGEDMEPEELANCESQRLHPRSRNCVRNEMSTSIEECLSSLRSLCDDLVRDGSVGLLLKRSFPNEGRHNLYIAFVLYSFSALEF
ncbi:hypothetical protein MUK42_12152 [Musa troglodytarum]|uniref:Uncharacterized protein n=1 Tax=Musa troglodytarum TaxID=320322 RepID=A0A9E7KFY2_9LILI|nr:hypothetical protein MUK42_12152 [Musa troglodytarum]